MLTGDPIIHDGTGTTAYYSPSFSRGGDGAVFSLDVTHESGSPTMVVKVDHRNEDDVGWETAGTFSNITDVGLTTLDIGSGLKQVLRFAFTFSAGSAGDFFHVVIGSPGWRPY